DVFPAVNPAAPTEPGSEDPARATPPARTKSTSGTLVRGESIGRYVVFDCLGQGGMGIVYAAYDPELDREAAVNLVKLEAGNEQSSDSTRLRLLREAQAIARVQHPNVIAVHDLGTFSDEVFMAMEFVEGQTLERWGAEGERTWREVVRVYGQAGQGL